MPVDGENDDKLLAPSGGVASPFPALGVLFVVGLVDPEPAMGERDSINDAPKDDEGTNGFRPANPVTWETTGGDPCIVGDGGKVDILVDCDKVEEKRESDKAELAAVAPVP